MTKPMENRLALVTGASKGIGAATAAALASAGAHVVLTGRDVRALEKVEDSIHEAGGASTIAPVDLAESDGIARLASAIGSRWDRLDYLVLSAAYLPTLTPVTQIDGKQLSQALTVNFLASQALLANFDPLLKRADAGRVIGLTSSVGASPRAYWSATHPPRPRSTICSKVMRRRSRRFRRYEWPCSILARLVRKCARRLIRVRIRKR